jgi:hypothetical protein
MYPCNFRLLVDIDVVSCEGLLSSVFDLCHLHRSVHPLTTTLQLVPAIRFASIRYGHAEAVQSKISVQLLRPRAHQPATCNLHQLALLCFALLCLLLSLTYCKPACPRQDHYPARCSPTNLSLGRAKPKRMPYDSTISFTLDVICPWTLLAYRR